MTIVKAHSVQYNNASRCMDDGRNGGVSCMNPKYIVNCDYNYYQLQQQLMTNNGDDERVTLFYYTLLHLSSPRKIVHIGSQYDSFSIFPMQSFLFLRPTYSS